MSTIATSGSACSTRSRPAATLPAAPTTSMPALPSSTARPSRRASWSSMIDQLRHRWREPIPYRVPCANAAKACVAPCSTRTRAAHGRPSAPRSIVGRTHGEGHREAHPAAVADLVPDGRAPPGHRAGDPPRRRGLQRHERGRVRAPLLRRPRRARVARHPADGRQAARRRRRAGELLAAAGELPPPRDRVHRRRARRAAAPRCRCSTASSPTPSRCASRCSRSRGAARAR